MNKKKLVVAAVISISIFLTFTIILGVLHLRNNTKQPVIEPTISEYPATEVKQATTLDNCLISTGGVVYNLSGYIQNHSDIAKICGQIDPDLASFNLKFTQISSYNVGILAP